MTERKYRQMEGISRSELWRLRESPEKFIWYRDHPEEPTPALIFGSAVHKMLLEPDTFDEEYAIMPECDRRTKEGKATYEAFLAAADGKQVISQADADKAKAMVEKAKSIPFVEALLVGKHEVPMAWTDELTDEVCKVRLDCLTAVSGKPVVVDYKTAADASTEAFMKAAINYGYDFQAAMYCEAAEKTTGAKPIFVFIVQEKTEPYAVNILQADELLIKRGHDVFRELLGIYHECKKTNNWYGYLGAYGVINNLALPAWLAKEIE